MTEYYLITDTHLGHLKLTDEWKTRPEGFSEDILRNLEAWTKSSIPTSTPLALIHLGDICIGKDSLWHEKLVEATRGVKRILIKGNHDRKTTTWYLNHGWDYVYEKLDFTLKTGEQILLSHRPLDKEEGVDYNIHGHTHGNTHRDEESKAFYDPNYHKEYALEKDGYTPVYLETFIKR